jgi:hypothetical protein
MYQNNLGGFMSYYVNKNRRLSFRAFPKSKTLIETNGDIFAIRRPKNKYTKERTIFGVQTTREGTTSSFSISRRGGRWEVQKYNGKTSTIETAILALDYSLKQVLKLIVQHNAL